MGKSVEYRFVCPECAESIAVNEQMKEAIVNYGCIICGAAISASAFTAESPTC